MAVICMLPKVLTLKVSPSSTGRSEDNDVYSSTKPVQKHSLI